ncbi:hypothetical protein BC939DRAFT_499730 [Gamsiella multidivaricata]|uniref:uncharacterized protein n=1 Tax=Gamsiella multidivaricata TaxID=101098 RepID=UPI00221FF6D8|nr:uncharacterized protein BC939DRAFT_499730 [Gamsiella multidivaricata]KAG0368975.1 hypothetical protein BGZ54_000671 [Gamsiella multidivaricata]KAI7830246.1 hypothetical protein BC939DRAFT_499730 [Gamsiella multidivaricata]
MLTNFDTITNEHHGRVSSPLPMSAVYNKEHFISQFISLHHESTQPTMIHQLLSAGLPHTFSEFWILYDDYNRPVACVGANTVISNISAGYIGLFEAKTEQAGTAVLKAATEWLKRGGLNEFEPVHQIIGPVNMTTWLQYRLRVDTDPQPSMSFEPRHPEFYQACFAQAGFTKAADYYSAFFDMDQLLENYYKYVHGDTLEKLGLLLQPWNTLDFPASLNPERHPDLTPQDNVAKRVYDLSLELFRGKEFFDDTFSRMNHRQVVLNDMISRPEVDNASLMDLSTFVVDSMTGEDIGYVACWVENNETLVIKTLGFLSKARKTKAFAVSILEIAQRAKDRWACTKVVCALMNSNTVLSAERVAGKSLRHVYRLYIHQQPKPTMVRQSNQESYHGHIQDERRLQDKLPLIQSTVAAFTSTSPTSALVNAEPRSSHLEAKQRLKDIAQRSRGRATARL